MPPYTYRRLPRPIRLTHARPPALSDDERLAYVTKLRDSFRAGTLSEILVATDDDLDRMLIAFWPKSTRPRPRMS